jgi:hypothetical protein
MRFTIEQRFTGSPDDVARAYADPALYIALLELPKLSQPDVVNHAVDRDVVTLEVRYRFAGELSSAARAVIDPARLTWVERSVHHLGSSTATFTMLPDHYADRFRCSGSYRFEAAAGGTRRRGEGDLRVRALLVAGAVEGAIVSGLKEHLADEVSIVDAFVEARAGS